MRIKLLHFFARNICFTVKKVFIFAHIKYVYNDKEKGCDKKLLNTYSKEFVKTEIFRKVIIFNNWSQSGFNWIGLFSSFRVLRNRYVKILKSSNKSKTTTIEILSQV